MPIVRPAPLLLELDLTELPVAVESGDPLDWLRARGARHTLRPTLRALHEAAADPRVTGLIFKVGGALPWAAMQELRRGVRAFAASGKPALAWAESFGEGRGAMAAYVLATAGSEIWLQPGGDLGLLGVAVESTFLRGTLDRLGIEAEFEQRREYKNAPDALLRTHFSAAHREALTRLTESIFDGAVDDIAAGRSLPVDRVRELVDGGPYLAAEAHAAGLVDRLGYRDEVYAELRARGTRPPQLLFADRWRPPRRVRRPQRRPGYVALVEARGTIVSGRSRRGPTGRQVGSDSVGAALRAVIADDNARALVLHIDSPGGSSVASETIWREVCRVRESGRPVVVSMGDTAASGGYYIACPADVIVALPATLTGSIGVFGGKLVVRGLLERAGITTGTVQHGARALMYSARRGFDEDERERLAAGVDAVYDDFLAKVAAGRGRPIAEVEPLARGRVWTGSDALRNGLVDELGDLRDAVRVARARAGLRDDAPVRTAPHIAPLTRLRRVRNTDDPRAATTLTRWPGLDELAGVLELPATHALRMPSIRVR